MSPIAQAPLPAGSQTRGGQFSTFTVGDFFWGIDVLRVQEVLHFQRMTPIPLAPAVIEGLINLRGHIVTAVDLRRRLRLPPRPEGRSPMNVVVRTEGGAVSLLVDEIGDVLDVDGELWESPPENLDPAIRGLIRAVYKLSDRLLLILDAERTVDVLCTSEPRELGGERQFSTEREL